MNIYQFMRWVWLSD